LTFLIATLHLQTCNGGRSVGLSETRIERIVTTMRAIARSPDVTEFKVGFTFSPTRTRADAHRTTSGLTSFVILQDGLTREEGLDLEEELFRRCTADRDDILFRKYVEDVRSQLHRRSYGGTTAEQAEEPIHIVYMTWYNIHAAEPGLQWPDSWREDWRALLDEDRRTWR
jgi:hypothetical protein